MHSAIGELDKTFRMRAQIKSTIGPRGNIRWSMTNVFKLFLYFELFLTGYAH